MPSQMTWPSAHGRCPCGPPNVSKLLATLDDSARMAAWIQETLGDRRPATSSAKEQLNAPLHSALRSTQRIAEEEKLNSALNSSQQHVWFNSAHNSAIDITPYSQVYGLHPRFFNFDENGDMQISACADTWRPNTASPVAAIPSPCRASPAMGGGMSFYMPASGLLPAAPIASAAASPSYATLGQASPIRPLALQCAMAMPRGWGVVTAGPARSARGTPHASLAPCGFGMSLSETVAEIMATPMGTVQQAAGSMCAPDAGSWAGTEALARFQAGQFQRSQSFSHLPTQQQFATADQSLGSQRSYSFSQLAG